MSDTNKPEFEQYSQEVLDQPALFDLDDLPYGSELPIPDGVS